MLAAGGLVKGETIEAAAQKVGVDPNGLRQTLEAIAADAAAGFVAQAIQNTPAAADERYGVWFEPLLPRLSPMPET